MCYPSLAPLSIVSAWPLPLAPVSPVLRPGWGGQGAAGTCLWVLQAPLCTSAEQPDNGCCCRGPPHLLAALSGIPGAGPSPRRQRLVAGDSELNLPGSGGVALLLCRLAMCFSLEGVPQEKTFPVFGSGWAAPARG